jgi:hypothetical protein
MIRSTLPLALAGLALSACGDRAALTFDNPPAFAAPLVERDADGGCYGRDVTPAQIQTVTEQVMVQPASVTSDGTILSPAAFRTVTRQQITRERREVLFETICPEDLTPEFIGSLQRALKARDHYSGPISGVFDGRTARAVQSFQRLEGHDSLLLDIRTARQLGLVALAAEDLAAES